MNWLGRQLRGGPWIRNPNPHFDQIQISRFNIFDARTYLHKENSSIVFHGLCGLNASVFSTFSCVFLMLISWFFCCPPIYIIYRHIERTPGYIFFIFRIFSCSRPVFFFVFARVFSLHFLRFFVVCSCFFACPFAWFARFFCVVFSHFCGLPIFLDQLIYWVCLCVRLEDWCAESPRSPWKRNIVFFTLSRFFLVPTVTANGPYTIVLYLYIHIHTKLCLYHSKL